MKREKITAEARTILGKKTKSLRKTGILPVNLFGKALKSRALQVKLADFQKLHKKIGETALVDIEVGKEIYPVLVHNVQTHPVTGDFIHVDFHKVSLAEKIDAEIPLVVMGVSPAVSAKLGILIQPLNKLSISALPTDLPEKIEVDVTSLKEINQEIKIKDLKLPEKTALSVNIDPNTLVAKIRPMEEEVAETPAPAAVPAEGAATATAEGTAAAPAAAAPAAKAPAAKAPETPAKK